MSAPRTFAEKGLLLPPGLHRAEFPLPALIDDGVYPPLPCRHRVLRDVAEDPFHFSPALALERIPSEYPYAKRPVRGIATAGRPGRASLEAVPLPSSRLAQGLVQHVQLGGAFLVVEAVVPDHLESLVGDVEQHLPAEIQGSHRHELPLAVRMAVVVVGHSPRRLVVGRYPALGYGGP